MPPRLCFVALLRVLSLLAITLPAIGEPTTVPGLSAFDNGLTDLKSPDEQAALLKELGYEGICSRPEAATDALLQAIDRHGLNLSASYLSIPAHPEGVVPEAIAAHLGKLKGRRTLIWLNITKGSEEAAIRTTRRICDLAKASGLEVALYPHANCYTDTVRNCIRLSDAVDRDNLGLSFTLCHFLKQNDAKDLEATLEAAGPRLKLVQINGADNGPPGTLGWDRLIQPLGAGTFDIGRVFRCLDGIGYQGPFNLQCYQIKRPAREHLAASMRTWKRLHAEAAPDPGRQ